MAIAARRASFSPTPPPTAPAIATTRAIRRSAETVRCWPPARRAPMPPALITRHVWADARERADAHRLTPWGKRIYKRRKETVERSFADAKQLHGHRYARFRGLTRRQPASACSPPPPRTSRRSPWRCAKAQTRPGMRAASILPSLHTAKTPITNKTPPKIDGVCQQSEAARRRPFDCPNCVTLSASRTGSCGGPSPCRTSCARRRGCRGSGSRPS